MLGLRPTRVGSPLPPESSQGKAVLHSLAQKESVEGYLEYGRYEIATNLVDYAI